MKPVRKRHKKFRGIRREHRRGCPYSLSLDLAIPTVTYTPDIYIIISPENYSRIFSAKNNGEILSYPMLRDPTFPLSYIISSRKAVSTGSISPFCLPHLPTDTNITVPHIVFHLFTDPDTTSCSVTPCLTNRYRKVKIS